MWRRGFVIKEIMLPQEKLWTSENKFKYSSKINENSWILKALYGKHLLDFLKFLFHTC